MFGSSSLYRVGWLACLLMLTIQLIGCAPSIPNQHTPTPAPSPTSLPLPVQGGNIQIGETQTITLPGRTPVILQWYLEQPVTAEVLVQATSDNQQGGILDPIIEVLDEDYQRVVYADDGGSVITDPYIPSRWWDAGHYQIRLNTFDGYWSGTVTILIQPSELE